MNQDLEKRLVDLSNQLKAGEQRELEIGRMKIQADEQEKVIAHIYYKPTLEEELENAGRSEEKIIQIPFKANREGSSDVIATGIIDQENIRRSKKKGQGFSLVKSFVTNKINEWRQELESMSQSEDDLNRIFVDDKGRKYEMIDGVRTFLDDRGFDYYLKWDLDGNEYAWVKLTDGSIGTFLDPERTIIMIGEHAYRFDGTVHLDEEVDFIFPHR